MHTIGTDGRDGHPGGARDRARQAALVLGWRAVRSFLRGMAKASARQATAEAVSVTPKVQESTRDSDCDEHPNRDTPSHYQWGTFLVGCTIACTIASGGGFLFIYWTSGSTQLLGGTLALFFGSIGVGFVLYAHWLIVQKEATEARPPMTSSPEVREGVEQDFYRGIGNMHRRGLLKWIGGAAITLMAAMAVSLIRSLGASPDRSLFDRIWKRGQRLMTEDGTPVSLYALDPGSFMIVFPEDSVGDERAQTVLIRVKESLLRLPEDRADWAPMGYVAYSRVCTHAGCSVGQYETTAHLLMCPCHQSTFDVLAGAPPTSGPAARPLPQLPLYADSDGYLRAGGGFTAPPGPGFWEMPRD
jgi:ubiquinol-cytochrome c reductase iron-sulfur subunit